MLWNPMGPELMHAEVQERLRAADPMLTGESLGGRLSAALRRGLPRRSARR